MKHYLQLALFTILFCSFTLSTYARTDCSGYQSTYPDHYCDCYYDANRVSSLDALKDLRFNDSIWFKTSIKTFLNDGLTLYLFSESDVQVDIYLNCKTNNAKYSFTVSKNQTRDIDKETLNQKLTDNGVTELNIIIYVVFHPLIEGADCRLMCYPYNKGPQSTALDPLPVLIDMTYVSAHDYDVYELQPEHIPDSYALYTQWRDENNAPCHLRVTRGSADGPVVAEHDFLDSQTYFRFDPNLLIAARAHGESLFMHYTHDASAAGRIITREASTTEEVSDTTLCQGKAIDVFGYQHTTPGIVTYAGEWVGTSMQVHLKKYNLTFTQPELQYDTLRVPIAELPMLYRGQYPIPAVGPCDFDCTIHNDGDCDERVLLHLIREYDDYVDICYGETYTWEGTTYTQAGSYTKTLQSAYGCDSIVTLHLNILPPVAASEESATVCGTEGYTWNGYTYYESGSYTTTLTDIHGCDSVATLHLNIVSTADKVINQKICMGESWLWDVTGEEYGITTKETTLSPSKDKGNASTTQAPFTIEKDGITMQVTKGIVASSGAYYEVPANQSIVLSSTLGNIKKVEISCVGTGTANYGPGNVKANTGTYTYTTGRNGTWEGDAKEIILTVAPLKLRIASIKITYVDDSVVEGTVTVTKANEYGCDVNYILNWSLIDCTPDTVRIHETACDSYIWHGQTLNQSGTYYYDTISTEGRDSVEVLTLTIHKSQTVSRTVVACDSYTWTNGQTYTASGTYTQNLQTIHGCDSIEVLHLTINKTVYAEQTITACDAYTWNGQTYTKSGDYTYTTTAKNGCDSITTLHLTIRASSPASDDYATICYGETYTWNGNIYATSGTYPLTLSNAQGCDSVVTLHLTILPATIYDSTYVVVGSNEIPYAWHGHEYTTSGQYTTIERYTVADCDSAIHVLDLVVLSVGAVNTQDTTLCESALPYLWHGQSLSQSGTYTYVEQYAGTDIDSIHHILNLSIIPTTYTSESASICHGESYTWHGQSYQAAGDYTITLTSQAGCDSVVTLHLTVNKPVTRETSATACDSYIWTDGKTYTASGIYTQNLQTIHGCDSIEVLHLTINHSDTAYFTATACDSYEWHGEIYTASGTYEYLTPTIHGCDSLEILHLTINSTKYAEITATACDAYTWNGEIYTTSGDYVYTTTAANGCDSITTLHLTINYSDTVEYTATACDSYEWHGNAYTTSGAYTYHTTTVRGCDSLEILHLTINASSPASDEYVAICHGESYTWHGHTYTASGVYSLTLSNTNACDSVVTLHLTVLPAAFSDTLQVVIGNDETPYAWRGKEYSMTGQYFDIEKYAHVDCDSAIHMLDLVVLFTDNIDQVDTLVCESSLPYEWYGQPLTQGGKYSFVEQYAGTDIDSIQHILNLSIIPTTYTSESVSICHGESYTWHGQSYQAAGDYTITLTSQAGCDSVVTLHLTVNKPVTRETRTTACDSYTWTDGKTYTASGIYTQNLQTIYGCDSIEVLHLTINHSDTATFTATACDSYEWHGETYTASGTYEYLTPTIHGCDSLEVLHLTINHTKYAEITATACDAYTWNGETYTKSGDYTYTTTAKNGCDSVVTLHLTVNKSTTRETSATACDSYTWTDGKTYTASGIYTQNLQTIHGCDSIEVLHLTINQTKYAEETVTACDAYTWNGASYTTSGDYVYTTTAANGCDSITTLHLTINYADTVEFTAIACDSYEWHGETYTTSGTYEYLTTTVYGCDSLEVLQLTINHSVENETTVTACDAYTWNDHTYIKSGDYVYTTTAANGCDSIVTLHLTIAEPTYSTHYATVCSGSAYEWNGQYYDVSGEYSVVLTNVQGCDSVATLYLTVMPEAIVETEELTVCASDLPYMWYGSLLSTPGAYMAAEPFATVECDSVVHILNLQTYEQSLPDIVTLPTARAGEPVDTSIPTAEIQAYIDQSTWYAPNTLITWLVMNNDVWNELTLDPIDSHIKELILKYVVDSDCGRVESEEMTVSVISTSLDAVEVPRDSAPKKILLDNQVMIIRGGKIYTIMGIEIKTPNITL